VANAAQLWWTYYPDRMPDDVLLVNLQTPISYSIRLYWSPDRPPRKLTCSDLSLETPRDLLSKAAWKKAVEQGVPVTNSGWWYRASQDALERARKSVGR
jgi:hypothetical protein